MSKLRNRSKINDFLDDQSDTEKKEKPNNKNHSSDQDMDEEWFNEIDDCDEIFSSYTGED